LYRKRKVSATFSFTCHWVVRTSIMGTSTSFEQTAVLADANQIIHVMSVTPAQDPGPIKAQSPRNTIRVSGQYWRIKRTSKARMAQLWRLSLRLLVRR